ncbi:MAG TPA: phosphoglycerate dehydrogenase [Candidatus Acidoferrales bacterium]|nr:phosphoglycerate dehydrogenase [Candidatus Acidoferrales bacterium]
MKKMKEFASKVVLLENVHPGAAAKFREAGCAVTEHSQGVEEEDALSSKLAGISILGIRSKTKVTPRVVARATRLDAVGAFCIGTDQIDLDACTKKGIAVFNAPYSSTRSVVELVLGEIILLARGVFGKSQKLHRGVWDKSAAGSNEIRGKKLGIVGYGKIGSQLSVLAEALGMEVYFFDVEEKLVLGNAKKVQSLEQLFKTADIVTLHVDGRSSNRNLIGRKEFAHMKRGAIFLNASRGFVVDDQALAESLKNGKLRAAAIDVFPREPRGNSDPFSSPLQGMEQVILTPHVAGSTEEAQKDIGAFVSERIIEYFQTGSTMYSVNFPNVQLPKISDAHRLIHIHENIPGMLAQINKVFARHEANILGQYLKTSEIIGYAITDISTTYNPKIMEDLKAIPHTIKFRVLY